MIGTSILHYRILEKLGQGGMGVVYKAEDVRLHRTVALKFLPDELSRSADDLARFQAEAQAISALNHPGIATLYDIGEADGRRFLALEFIGGGTLRARIAALRAEGKTMPIEEATSILTQAAEALDHAHRAGIVHRDVKSDNIMLTLDGRVKITDFGLAKLRGAGTLTQTGSTVGTLSYMAPEQMRGEEVDARADIFSLGVVAYELLTLQLPFRGEHEAAIMYSVLHEEPQPVDRLRPDVPQALAAAITRSLEKDPARRYASAAAMLADLRRPGSTSFGTAAAAVSASAAAPPDVASIVVLPFQNMSPDKENEYFSDGLTEELISDLSAVRSLRVISRTSAMRLKGSQKDIRAIASDLGVRYILEGSVRKAGQSLRITVQLIDGATDANLWTEKYSGTLDDVFEIQEKVSRAIVGALKVVLSTEEERQMEARPIQNAQAHDLFLRARQELQRGIPESLDKSIELLNAGLALVGENESLYAALGHTYYSYFRWISKADESYLSRAADYVRKVFALNPASSHGFTLQGMISGSQGDIGASIRSLKRARAIDPSNAEALLWLAAYSAYAGKTEDAAEAASSLAAIDPFTPISRIIQTVAQIYAGDFEGALPWMLRAYEMDRESPLARWTLLITYAWCGRTEEAITQVDELALLAPNWIYTHHALFLKHALRGEKTLALSYDTPELALEAKYDLHFSLHVAHCFALVGENEKALGFLEHAVRMGMINHPFLSRFDPLLAGIRNDPQFTALMDDAKQRMEQLSV